MNRVDKIAFHLSGTEEDFFRTLHANFNQRWVTAIERVTEKVLDKLNEDINYIEIDELELVLPEIPAENWNESFMIFYEKTLEEELVKRLQLIQNNDNTLAIKKDEKALLFHYLLHGQLLWKPNKATFNFQVFFLEIVRSHPTELYKFLRTYGHYASLQERLMYQLDDGALEKGVQLIQSAEAPFIIDYVKQIRLRLKKIKQAKITASNPTKLVWKVIYRYLLSSNSTFFNKKMFVKQTLAELAHRYNMNYTHLLRLITLVKPEAGAATEFDKIRYELFTEEQNTAVRRQDWRQWVLFLLHLEGSLMEGLTSDKWNLIQLLKSDNNNFLLQQLDEKEIHQLVKLVIPSEQQFVIKFVYAVDELRTKGELEGKTGGEFRLLKWKILFPILLQNNGSGFNRKYFVERVLSQLAAHYNLTIYQLLLLLDEEEMKDWLDTDFIKIWKQLISIYAPNPKKKDVITLLNKDSLLLAIKKKETLSEFQMKELNKWMDSSIHALRLFDSLKVIHLQVFIRLNYKKEEQWIIQYANYLDILSTPQELTLTTRGPIQEMKWYFLFQVLFSTKGRRFNKVYIVHQIVLKIAAHYNLKQEKVVLLLTEHLNKMGAVLPRDLFQILLNLKASICYTTGESKTKAVLFESSVTINDQVSLNRFEKGWKDEKEFLAWIRDHEFATFIQPVWRGFKELEVVLNSIVSIKRDQLKDWLQVFQFFKKNTTISQLDWIKHIVSWLLTQLKNPSHKNLFIEKLVAMDKATGILDEVIKELKTQHMHEESEEELEPNPISGSLAIQGAGIILIAGYLPRLFSMLQYLEEGKFVQEEKQIRAVFIIQYLAYGAVEFQEYELTLAKLLIGMDISKPLPNSIVLSAEEMETANGLLHAVTQHWTKITTVEGLREGFLQREGELHFGDEKIELKVYPKAYDMLLDSIPWNYKTTKFSWMDRPIITNWR